MSIVNCAALFFIICAVFCQDGTSGLQDKLNDTLIRLKRYGTGGWHWPTPYKNHHNHHHHHHWHKEASHSWSNRKSNKTNIWLNTGSSSQSVNIRPNENKNVQSQYIPHHHSHHSGFQENFKPNLKPPYPFEKDINSTPHWGYLPTFQKPKQKNTEINNKSVNNAEYQYKPNLYTPNVKYDNTFLTFNRTNIIKEINEKKVTTHLNLNTHSIDEPVIVKQTDPGKGNRTDLSKIKVDQVEESIHNIFQPELMIDSNVAPKKPNVITASNESTNANLHNSNTKTLKNEKSKYNDHTVKKNDKLIDELLLNTIFADKNTNVSVTDDIMNSPFGKLNIPTPEFHTPGLRVSEIKCYEYLWYLKKRIDDSQRKKTRDEYIRRIFFEKFDKGEQERTTIGGRDTMPGEFPHMGALGWKAKNGTWIFKCGSSLISHKFVLTAAHCSSQPDLATVYPDPKIVRLGDKNIVDVFANDHEPFDVNILKIIPHPKYSSPKQYYDIALVELVKEVQFTKFIHPACLWTNFDTRRLGKEATLTGWGVIESAGLTTSPELQAAVVDIIDTDVCNKLLESSFNRNWCGVQDHQICAGKLAGGVDACQGDSGGPLQVKIPFPDESEGSMHFVVGVISFGVKCARPQLPGIYTRVASFLDWIESIVWPLG